MRGRSSQRPPAPRKEPTRTSAEAIVVSILRAAEVLLERDGLDGLTTNAVARVAGVSVGSLYQYFPDKQAIVAEIARRIEATAIQIMIEERVRLRDSSAREAIARVTRLSCAPGFGTNELRRAVLRE